MSARDRILTALQKRVPDQVPAWELLINEPVLRALGGEKVRKMDLCDTYSWVAEDLELEGVTAMEEIGWEYLNEDVRRDEWGVVWRRGAGSTLFPVEGPIKTSQDLRSLRSPDPEASHRLEPLRRLVARFKGDKAIAFCVQDAFEYPSFLRGVEHFLLDYVLNPALVHDLVEMVISYYIRLACLAIDVGADFIVSGDDYAYKSGPLMSPEQFRIFVKPYLQRLVEAVKRKGVPFVKHCDGYIWPILEDMVEMGIDGLHPIEVQAGMDLGEVKKVYGQKLCLLGNVDCSYLLPFGTPQEVERAVVDCLSKAGPGGGYILSSSNTIHDGVNPRNYRLMLKFLRKHGRYPLQMSPSPNLVEECGI